MLQWLALVSPRGWKWEGPSGSMSGIKEWKSWQAVAFTNEQDALAYAQTKKKDGHAVVVVSRDSII